MGGVALLSHPFATVRPVNHGLPTRNEQAPDNHVVVIRAGAGVLTGKSVEEAATRCLQGYDIERGITFQVLDGSVEEHRHLLPSA